MVMVTEGSAGVGVVSWEADKKLISLAVPVSLSLRMQVSFDNDRISGVELLHQVCERMVKASPLRVQVTSTPSDVEHGEADRTRCYK